jgi:hypothetical protein
VVWGSRCTLGATARFFLCGELADILTFGFFWRGEFAGVSIRYKASGHPQLSSFRKR